MSIYWRIKTYPNNIEIVLKLVINATLWTGKKKVNLDKSNCSYNLLE